MNQVEFKFSHFILITCYLTYLARLAYLNNIRWLKTTKHGNGTIELIHHMKCIEGNFGCLFLLLPIRGALQETLLLLPPLLTPLPLSPMKPLSRNLPLRQLELKAHPVIVVKDVVIKTGQ